MTAFFIKTDSAVVGPFTGVELREAALAGILAAESVISLSPQGPWKAAAHAGLFSEKRVALPHPPDVHVPVYQVRGMAGAFKGPFKLRELIGFAARGMLPPEATLQSDPAQPWIPVSRIHILTACLEGDLALVDHNGKVIRRAVHPAAPGLDMTAARAPVELAKRANDKDTTAFASPSSEHESLPVKVASPKPLAATDLDFESGEAASWLGRLWLRFPRAGELDFAAISRRSVPVVIVLLLIAIGGAAMAYWQQRPLRRDQIIGDWIGTSLVAGERESSQFGISFRKGGSCVVFNPLGGSWSGDFVWEDRLDNSAVFEDMDPYSATVDVAEPNHETEAVRPADGYIRFIGRGDDGPTIDGHRISDAFLRLESGSLRIGYLVSVKYGLEGKSIQAAWLTATKSESLDSEVLAAIESNRMALGVSRATELLSNYGMPDQARAIYPFEIPPGQRREKFSDVQVIRYGNTEWMLTADGQIQPLVAESR